MVKAYTYSQRGKPANVLRLIEDYNPPALQDDQVRVKVKAVGLNPVDCEYDRISSDAIVK